MQDVFKREARREALTCKAGERYVRDRESGLWRCIWYGSGTRIR